MQIQNDVALATRTTLGVGGAAAFYAAATSEAEVAEALAWAKQRGVRVHVLGGGSNVVVADAGVDGLVLEIAITGIGASAAGDAMCVEAGAGESWDGVVAHAVGRGWAGIECLSGIPGRVGATPIQNVGAYGQDVSETVVKVRCLDREALQRVEFAGAECGFSYRNSRFKSDEPGRYVVLAVTYRLMPGGAPALRYPELSRHVEERHGPSASLAQVRESVLAVRRGKSMVFDPADPNRRSCGSFFVNPIVDADALVDIQARVGDAGMPRWPEPDGRTKLSAAWLIERAGFSRGELAGAVGLSTKHTLCLVAHEGARADDVVAFARRIRARVAERFGVRLVPEPDCWGFLSLDDRLPDDRVA